MDRAGGQLVSRIGAPVDDPQLVHLRAWLERGVALPDVERIAAAIVQRHLAELARTYEAFLARRVVIC